MCFNNVAHRPYAESFLRHIGRRFLSHEEYFALRAELADSSSGFDPIECVEPDIEHDQVRLQFFGSTHRFQSVWRLTDDLQIRSFRQRRTDEFPKRFVIIDHEDTER